MLNLLFFVNQGHRKILAEAREDFINNFLEQLEKKIKIVSML